MAWGVDMVGLPRVNRNRLRPISPLRARRKRLVANRFAIGELCHRTSVGALKLNKNGHPMGGRFYLIWWAFPDLNWGPADYEKPKAPLKINNLQ